MSKTPLITKNDGTDWHDAVPKLRTDELGGTSTDWVQDDDTKADRLNVTANGTYTAASAGKYGYDYITVSVPGTGATGTGTDGEIHHVEPDPETGELVDTVLPSSIEVTTPPTNTDYVEGETIDYTGIGVTAYLASGETWEDEDHPNGIIPFAELLFPVTIASRSGEFVFDSSSSEFDLSPLPNPISYATGEFANSGEYDAGQYHYVYTYTFTPVPGKTVKTFGFGVSEEDGLRRTFFASDHEGEIGMLHHYRVQTYPSEQVMDDTTSFISATKSYTYNGKTVYYFDGRNTSVGIRNYDTSVGLPDYVWPNNSGISEGELAWTMIYGDATMGGYKVPVDWQRPGDGAVLEATTLIKVTPSST